MYKYFQHSYSVKMRGDILILIKPYKIVQEIVHLSTEKITKKHA